MSNAETLVQQLYVAYFSRPADAVGLDFWQKALQANPAVYTDIARGFAASDEYQAMYGGRTNDEVINAVYRNLFGRDAEPAAQVFWGRALDQGHMTVADAVLTISGSALGSDATAFGNKVKAAYGFTAALATPQQARAYEGARANKQAKKWLTSVTDDATLAAAVAPQALEAAIGEIVALALNEPGQTLTLTRSDDRLVGGSGDDLFKAVFAGADGASGTTLGARDVLDGGIGTDRLQIDVQAALAGLPAVDVRSIETVQVHAGADSQVDVSGWRDVELLELASLQGSATLRAAAHTDIAASIAGTQARALTIEGGRDVAVTAENSNAAIAVRGAAGAVQVEVTGIAAVNGGRFNMADINVEGGTRISVAQQAASDTRALDGTRAIHQQGKVHVVGGPATTEVVVRQTPDAPGQDGLPTIAFSNRAVTITFQALKANDSVRVGTLYLQAQRDMSAAEVAQHFSHTALPGDWSWVNWASGAAAGEKVTFTSNTTGQAGSLHAIQSIGAYTAIQLQTTYSGGAGQVGRPAHMEVKAGTVDIHDAHGTLRSVTLDGFGAGSVVSGPDVRLASLSLANSSNDLRIAGTDRDRLDLYLDQVGTTAKRAELSWGTTPAFLSVSNSGDNFLQFQSGAPGALLLDGSGVLDARFSGRNAGTIDTVTVRGAAGLAADLRNASQIDASATSGAMRATIDPGRATYAGGSGSDDVVLGNVIGQLAGTVALGAGDDVLDARHINMGNLDALPGRFEGGAGVDRLILNPAITAELAAAGRFANTFAGFEQLTLAPIVHATTIDVAKLTGINDVTVTAGGATTLTSVTGLDYGQAGTQHWMQLQLRELAAGHSITLEEINWADLSRQTLTVTATGGAASAADVRAALLGGKSVGNAILSGALSNWDFSAYGNAPANALLLAAKSVGARWLSIAGDSHQVLYESAGRDGRKAFITHMFNDMVAGQKIEVGGMLIEALGTVSGSEIAALLTQGTAHPLLRSSGFHTGWVAEAPPSAYTNDVRFTAATVGTGAVTLLDVVRADGGSSTVTLENMHAGVALHLEESGDVVARMAGSTGAAGELEVYLDEAGRATVRAEGAHTVRVHAQTGYLLTLDSDRATSVVLDNHAAPNPSGKLTVGLSQDAKGNIKLIDGSALKIALNLSLDYNGAPVPRTIKGGAGNDELTASLLNADVLEGGAGNDILVAGRGAVRLTGGEGNDTFRFPIVQLGLQDIPTITDFSAGDTIILAGANRLAAKPVVLGAGATLRQYAEAAGTGLGRDEAGWFVYGGDTYLVVNRDFQDGFTDGSDMIVRLAGVIDPAQTPFNPNW